MCLFTYLFGGMPYDFSYALYVPRLKKWLENTGLVYA